MLILFQAEEPWNRRVSSVRNMIWSKSRASTVNHGENVSTNIVDVMHSAQLAVVVEAVSEVSKQPEVNLPSSLVHRSNLGAGQPGSEDIQSLLLLATEVSQKSSISEAYYNLDKVLSWSAAVREISVVTPRSEEEKAVEKTESLLVKSRRRRGVESAECVQ